MKYKLKVFNRHTKDFKYEITENGHTMIPEDVVKGLNDKELLLKKKKCVAGCKHFEGGEIKHHKECDYYTDSLSKKYDDLEKNDNLQSLGQQQIINHQKNRIDDMEKQNKELIESLIKYAEQCEFKKMVSGSYGHLQKAHEKGLNIIEKVTGKTIKEILELKI